MSFSLHPITPDFAAEIGDIDLRKPLSEVEFKSLENAFNTYSVLVFPDQTLSEKHQMKFSSLFGPLETSIQKFRKGVKLRLGPKFADVSNLGPDNEILGEHSERRLFNSGNQLWHTDSSFMEIPAKCSLLYAKSIPPVGGQTEFVDLRAAYDALPKKTKDNIKGLVAEHSIRESRIKIGYKEFTSDEVSSMPPVPQVLVRTHEGSGRRTLYLASHAARIIGLSDEEGKALLAELIGHSTQRRFVYTHRWRAKDLVMWDNRNTMHRGKPFEDLRYKRDMRRTTVRDVSSTCEQEGIHP
ncbi:MAG: 2,4-dichlorophenoxyacetate dioxygenase [Alphaproteobacteria bacterium]|nr:2,4-dichlorophenoxyacetate dioxygenase [Alphaproteobacteria bacterium]PPR14563.1 MAG: Alpha-ketoglutarate-dependent 2,4-dichlorophenoxyacetate dioxygenase [Alphaproteobacteria bacterium MarineAlpha12_Bin1]